MRVVRLVSVCVLLGVVPIAACAQAYRCTIDGKTVYQQAPCAQGAAGEVKAAPAGTAPAPQPKAPTALVAAETPVAPAQRAERGKSALEVEADQCLDWYRPRLRDPRGAYYSAPSKEQRVLTIVIHATNGYGGFVTKRASCEMLNGRLDNDWTAIHARDGGWR
jgi:hypothetical protein